MNSPTPNTLTILGHIDEGIAAEYNGTQYVGVPISLPDSPGNMRILWFQPVEDNVLNLAIDIAFGKAAGLKGTVIKEGPNATEH